jgi:transcriptional regulator with XRE-family HTH domain
MTEPNRALQAVRKSLMMSQEDFARALRQAGERLGSPNEATKRLVQRWESGVSTSPRPVYARALESVTSLPIAQLGFNVPRLPEPRPDGRGGHDLRTASYPLSASSGQPAQPAGYSGVWLSRYEYYSSSREESLADLRYVVVLQHGDRLTVRGLPGASISQLTMDLTVDATVVTGAWVEQTEAQGHYKGARYHGAIQMIADPTGRRMAGKWVGFGKDLDINSGPWELAFMDSSTSRATLERYSVDPADHAPGRP